MKKLVLLSLVFLLAGCHLHQPSITSKTIWKPSKESVDKIMQCHNSKVGYLDCVSDIMEQDGASRDAVRFTRQLQGFGFASEITMYDKIAFVKTLQLGADYSTGYYLVNGRPFIVDVNNAKYIGKKAFPSDHQNPKVNALKNGDQVFTFTYPIKACHACKVTGMLAKKFIFDQENSSLIRVE